MPKTKLSLALAITVLAGFGCVATGERLAANPGSSIDSLLVQAIVHAAEQQQGRPVSIVMVGPDVPEHVARATTGLRPTCQVNSSEIGGLGDGQLLLQSAVVGPNVATISGRLGPVPRPRSGEVLLSCGTGLTVVFEKVGADWQQRELQTLEC